MSQNATFAGAPGESPFDPREYLAPVWRRRWLIALLVVLAAGGAYVLAARQHAADQRHRTYAASTEVYIEVANPADLVASSTAAPPNPPNGQQMSDLATLFTAQSITHAVSRALAMPVARAGTISASLLASGSAATYGTSIIVVDTTSSSPLLAARLANVYVRKFLASRRAAQAAAASGQARALNAQLGSLGNGSGSASERQALRLQVAQLRATALSPSPGAYQISPATPPTAPLPAGSSRSSYVDAAIAAVVALLLGIGLAVALSAFDRRLRRVAAVESSYRGPVLGVLPHVARASGVSNGRVGIPAEFVETLRSLRISLRLLSEATPIRTLVVTSALPGEGKSTVAAHLALAHVESGDRVLLIDADLRRPSVAAWFGVTPAAGLLQVLRGECAFAEAVVPLHGATPNGHAHNGNGNGNGGSHNGGAAERVAGALSILAHGGAADRPTALLAPQGMAAVLAAAAARYDIVIVDTAPVLAVADTVPLLGSADAVLMVARLGATSRDAAERLADVIARVPDANVVGVVANDAHDSLLGDGYGGLYSSGRKGYGYGYGEHAGRRSRRRSGMRLG